MRILGKNKINKKNIFLAILCLILGVILIIALAVKGNEKTSQYKKSTILNPKYKEKISRIEISTQKYDASIKKTTKNYDINYDNLNNFKMSYLVSYFFKENYDINYDKNYDNYLKADKKLTDDLIENMTNVIILGKVDKNVQKKNEIFFESSIKVWVEDSTSEDGEKLVLDVLFSPSDYTATRRFIKNNMTGKIFVIEDTYSQYFDLSYKDFLNKAFFSEEIQQNTSLIEQILVVDEKNHTSRTLSKSSRGFDEKLKKIVFLQSGNIVESNIVESNNKNALFSLVLQDCYKNDYEIKVYEYENQKYVLAQGILYKISERTYESLSSL